ncbi:hypothetical protein Xoosp2_78 [Xanthomonas phage Xoo-sp2]|uniref:Uncharacterized protein n=1 Tax=Xanthomonas phage Xoo-sp2 TaxID=1852622 RepID=A0A1X9IAT6_9CAUD|nr:hypothetical protein JTY55_gp78 [Xanthomonas phage Xoo-sp2]ANT45300.1 hypothetical protein Xoosp2_78 [Xanthomonas phage Xoo-sp2]
MSRNERTANFELVDQRTEDQRWREEALEKLAPKPGQREALEAYRQRQQTKRAGPFKRVLRFLRGRR